MLTINIKQVAQQIDGRANLAHALQTLDAEHHALVLENTRNTQRLKDQKEFIRQLKTIVRDMS
jgi:hypothetical protein